MATPRRYVLDANALLGFFDGRAQVVEKIRHLLGEALRSESPLLMSSINWGEIVYLTWRHRGEKSVQDVNAKLQRMPITIIAADQERAWRAAALKQKHHLGYADAFAAELALECQAWLVTADPDFERVGKLLNVYSLPRHEK